MRLPGAEIEVRADNGELTVEAIGSWSVLDFEKGKRQPLKPLSNNEFRVESGYHTRLAFLTDASGKVTRAVLNPGAWQIEGAKLD